MHAPKVFTIKAGAPFLPTLVKALMSGALVPGLRAGSDPFWLADTTLYLPTRRAARAIREVFLAELGRPVLLPTIRTLGDIDEDEGLLPEPAVAESPAAIGSTERKLALTGLVLGWSRALIARAADVPDDEEDLIPASPADALRLAGALGELIDQVGAQPGGWTPLFSPLDADLARYWEITRDFLEIATAAWPDYLAGRGLIDPGLRRDRMVRAEAERLARSGSRGPVIAAGSTGSVPATAVLLRAISRLPNGAVVLPGLDLHLDPESWAAVGPSDGEPAGAGHPQFGLKRLLETLATARSDVIALGEQSPKLELRSRFVSEAMRPAATTERWAAAPSVTVSKLPSALSGLALIEAANEREEAQAIALVLRGAAETPGRVAALVTPDRTLARRVAIELRRWDINVDDSGGRPLGLSRPGVLARLVAEAALGGLRPEPLLALTKHPLAGFGLRRAEARRGARALERAVLRGPRLKPGMAALRHAFDKAASAEADGWRGLTRAAQTLTDRDWTAAADLLARIEVSLAPLHAFSERGSPVAFAALVTAHRESFEAAAKSDDMVHGVTAEERESLERAFDDLAASADVAPDILPGDYPAFFSALLDGHVVRPRGGVDPRIHIWGTLEARLQSVDVAVLGGLNEGTWPSQTALDPLLSRTMRAALSLDPPERRLGLSAHDFSQALGHPEVWLTRAERQDGQPAVASRWLQRILALAGDVGREELRRPGKRICRLARLLDAPSAPAESAPRPHPKPALEHRPKRLSATEIETLIRDPYAIYARRILKLAALEPVGSLPDASERGSLFHSILERFIKDRPTGPFDAAATDVLLAIGREEFAAFEDFPEIAALWWPRFEKIARWFVNVEAARSDVERRIVEGTGEIPVGADFTLRARADRIDILRDGRLALIDYKTGAPPGVDEVLSLSPQLPLEAVIAEAGGFRDVPAGEVARLQYYRISGHGEGGKVCDRGFREGTGKKPAVTLPQTIALTRTRLVELVADFARPNTGYLSRKIPRRGGDFAGVYDHLARVAEWQVADAEEDE